MSIATRRMGMGGVYYRDSGLGREVASEAADIHSWARCWRSAEGPVAEGDSECGRTGARRDWAWRAASRADARQAQTTVAPGSNARRRPSAPPW